MSNANEIYDRNRFLRRHIFIRIGEKYNFTWWKADMCRNKIESFIYSKILDCGDYDDFDDVEELIQFVQTGKR